MRSPRASPAVLLVALTALAGCTDHSSQRARGGVLRMTVSEYRVRPQDAVAAPGRITLVVHNAGRLAHDLRVREGQHVLGGAHTVAPGTTCQEDLTLTPGTYRMFSSLRRDEALGLWGELTVKGSASARRTSETRVPAPAQAGRADSPPLNPAATEASGAGSPSDKIQPCRSKSTATPSARSSATSPPG